MNSPGFMVAVIAALGGFMLGVRALQARRWVGPEAGRKLVHAGMGAIAFSFPWIFPDARPVWLLVILSVVLLGLVRLVPAVARHFGHVLGGVNRTSLGEIFFPVGVALAFTFADRNAAAFCAGVGVLAFADTAGALVGTRWGRRHYTVVGGQRKSLEGSAAVWVVATLCVAVAAVMLGGKSWPAGWLAGLGIGLVVMLVEAVSAYGLDNLFLPGVVVCLMKL